MKPVAYLSALAVASTLGIGSLMAGEPTDPAVKARQSLMTLYAHNLGLLGGMAQGKVDYDSEAAQKAADSLAHLVQLDQSRMWPAGSDNATMDGTRALPAIWQNFPDVGGKAKVLFEAVNAMQAAAGKDVDSLRGAIGPLGGACGACHKVYRAP